MAVTLAQLKAHLVIEHDEDDALLTPMIEAARLYFCHVGVDVDVENATRDQAALLLLAEWYEQRASNDLRNGKENTFAVHALLAPFREVIT